MILESDAIYLHPNEYPEASPMLLKGMHQELADLFRITMEEVAEVTSWNVLEVYDIK